MCLAIVGKVIEIHGPSSGEAFPEGTVDVSGVRRQISFGLLDSVRKGDYVLVHAGFAIQKMTAAEARKTMAAFAGEVKE